jgi:hypothetical protein
MLWWMITRRWMTLHRRARHHRLHLLSRVHNRNLRRRRQLHINIPLIIPIQMRAPTPIIPTHSPSHPGTPNQLTLSGNGGRRYLVSVVQVLPTTLLHHHSRPCLRLRRNRRLLRHPTLPHPRLHLLRQLFLVIVITPTTIPIPTILIPTQV